jgi:hypothetical protein
MTREVYTNRDFLVEEAAAWVMLLVGVLMGYLAETPLIGIALMVGACLLTYHSHRRAFRCLVDRRISENER